MSHLHPYLSDPLLRARAIRIEGEITEEVALDAIARLLFLESENDLAPATILIDSCGGSIVASLAIHDTYGLVRNPIKTVCTGSAGGMAGLLLASGTRGQRFILPDGKVQMVTVAIVESAEPVDIRVHVDEVLRMHELVADRLAFATGLSRDTVDAHMERRSSFSAGEAISSGFVDAMLERRQLSGLLSL